MLLTVASALSIASIAAFAPEVVLTLTAEIAGGVFSVLAVAMPKLPATEFTVPKPVGAVAPSAPPATKPIVEPAPAAPGVTVNKAAEAAALNALPFWSVNLKPPAPSPRTLIDVMAAVVPAAAVVPLLAKFTPVIEPRLALLAA